MSRVPAALFAASLAATLFVGCAPPAPLSHDLTEADLAAVRAAFDSITAAEGRGDWDALETYLVDDVVHLDPRLGMIRGKAVWRQWVDSMNFDITQPADYRIEEIAGSGDLAYAVWTFSGSWSEGGKPVTSQGKGLTVFRRMPDGSWKEARNAWNATPTAPTGG